ncbi:lytic polysaccharide monooxygenase [Nocardiopsis mangrovi]|uniref:Lytic polysaccharide monooxygenase n=1 Tax=Nocardiopsis mangrovi TaxID=1179818 RepID=A0ABV9DSG2_9ACTN
MHLGRLTRTAAVLAGIPIALAVLAPGTANAHGTMGSPISRVASCYAEGPETPSSDVCRALIAENGTQPLYDWHEVNIANADGRHREIIPDGELCSAGRDKYSGLDAPGAWETTALPASGEFTFTYTAAVPHRGYFELYVTENGWDQSRSLAWGDLEAEPFLRVDDPQVVDGNYELTGALPEGKTGQHLIYAVWQRTDSPEAFYSCSDVTFGGAAGQSAEAFEATPDDYGDAAHADHEQADGPGTTTEAAGDEAATAQLASAATGGHGGHAEAAAAPGTATSGTAVTGLFLAAFAALTAASGAIWLRRRRSPRSRHS